MDDRPYIFDFAPHDPRIVFLTKKLDELKISYSLRETTAYMEQSIELSVSKEVANEVHSMLDEVTSWETMDNFETNSILGKFRLRSVGVFLEWVSIITTATIVISGSWFIMNGDLSKGAWVAVIFFTLLLIFLIYLFFVNRKREKTD